MFKEFFISDKKAIESGMGKENLCVKWKDVRDIVDMLNHHSGKELKDGDKKVRKLLRKHEWERKETMGRYIFRKEEAEAIAKCIIENKMIRF